MENGRHWRLGTCWLVAAAMVLTTLVYWPGLDGPFLHDDTLNLTIVRDWQTGEVSTWQMLFGNGGWLTQRWVAMITFALNVTMGGYNTPSFKIGNLLIHLLCGVVAFVMLRKLASRDPWLSKRAPAFAALMVALWLLHPLNVSTVLYAVQRMAQLATLFVLLGLWLYVAVRDRMERGETRWAWPALLLGIPLLTYLGIQGKQNAAVLPLLCLVVELAYFSWPRTWPMQLRVFYGLFIALPALLAPIALAIRPGLLLDGYLYYDFTPWQRLLSQTRALCDYLWNLLAPYTPRMGVYTDDFPMSASLLSPPTTLPAIIFLLAVSIAAWIWRRRLPFLFFGWFFFMGGHVIESTLIPIELYYEHRNYLPAFGFFYVMVGLVVTAGERLRSANFRPGRVGVVVAIAVLLTLTMQTFGRSLVWKHQDTIAMMAVRTHPESMRANLNVMGPASIVGDYDTIDAAVQRLIGNRSAQVRTVGYMMRLQVDCLRTGKTDLTDLDAAVAQTRGRVDLNVMYIVNHMLVFLSTTECGAFDDLALARATEAMADNATLQPDDFFPKWNLRYLAARAYGRAHLWNDAVRQARLAWQPGVEPAVGETLAHALINTGDLADAEQVYREMVERTKPWNKADVAGTHALRELLDAKQQRAPTQNSSPRSETSR